MRKASLETWSDVEGYRQRLIQSSGGVATSGSRQGGAVIIFQGPAAGVTADHETQGPSAAIQGLDRGPSIFCCPPPPARFPLFESSPTPLVISCQGSISAAPLLWHSNNLPTAITSQPRQPKTKVGLMMPINNMAQTTAPPVESVPSPMNVVSSGPLHVRSVR